MARRKHAHMHTREDGGIDSQKVVDLTRDQTFQSPLTPGNEGSEEDIEMGLGEFEDITAEELEAPTAKIHEAYDLKEIDAIQKGVATQSVREEPTVRGRVERSETLLAF